MSAQPGQPITRLPRAAQSDRWCPIAKRMLPLAGALHGDDRALARSPTASRDFHRWTTAAEKGAWRGGRIHLPQHAFASSLYRNPGFTCIHMAKAIWCCKTIKFTMPGQPVALVNRRHAGSVGTRR